ncbi:uncharacterized protein LOC100883143 isoform X2 [Megachile rotundata]|nr:PREDICTED: uncharacterized protein LOC100883143 isoform X2 [Megachile rotundata]
MHDLPRVLHKLVLPIHPNIKISDKVNKLTGLSNTSLQEVQNFNCEVYDLIMHFINRLSKPVCFVAYNGNKFDYPIFLSELNNVNKNFSEDIFSIDMLELVRNYFSTNNKSVTRNTPSMSNTEDVSSLLNDGCDEMLCEAADSITSSTTDDHNEIKQVDEENNSCSSSGLNTPKHSYYKKMQEMNEKTPENQIFKLRDANINLYNGKICSARRRLPFTHKLDNYKLSTVAKHILGTDPENAHTAEGDCITMLRCAVKLGDDFVEWAEKRMTPFVRYERH